MKKIKLLALVLVIGVALSGIGYALWTDSIVVNATANTGNLDIRWVATADDVRAVNWGDAGSTTVVGPVDSQIVTQIGATALGSLETIWQHQHATISTQVLDNSTINVTASDLYPGAVFKLDLRAINVGTVPAKLTGIDVFFTGGNADLYNNLKVNTMQYFASNNGGKTYYNQVGNSINEYYPIGKWGVSGGAIWLRDLSGVIAGANNSKITSRVLEPNKMGVMVFDSLPDDQDSCISFKVNPDIGNSFMNQTCQFQLKFNFIQADVTPAD